MEVSQAEIVFDIHFDGIQHNVDKDRQWFCFTDNKTKSSIMVETLLELPRTLKEMREAFNNG